MNNYKPKRGHGFIYKYTSPSGKSYIGQTVQSLSNRAGHNGKNYFGCKYFWKAIQKYGWNNFYVEILGEFLIEELNYQERRFIEIFNTLAPNGYNIQIGGQRDYHKGRKRIYQYDGETGLLLKAWDSQIEAANALGVSKSSLNQCLLGFNKSCKGFYWSFQLLEKYPITEKIDNSEKKVYMLDINNNVLKVFDSITSAAQSVGGERSAIKRCCRGEIKTTCGYKWSCSEIVKEKKYNNTPIEILQLDKDTKEIIQTFPSISKAAKELNISGTSGIRRVLDNLDRTAYGYCWKRSQGSTTKYPKNPQDQCQTS